MSSGSLVLRYSDPVTQAGVALTRDARMIRIEVPVRRRWEALSLSCVRERVIFEVRADQLRVTHVAGSGTSVTGIPRKQLGPVLFNAATGKVQLSRGDLPPLEIFLHPEPSIGEWVEGALHEALEAPLQTVEVGPDVLVSSQSAPPPPRNGRKWIAIPLVCAVLALMLLDRRSAMVVMTAAAAQVAFVLWVNAHRSMGTQDKEYYL